MASPKNIVKDQEARGVLVKCRLCRVVLSASDQDDLARELCCSCKVRPEARRLGASASRPNGKGTGPHVSAARVFTPAEKDLIQKLHGYMPAQQLLNLLNERLKCDLGPDAMPYTMDQLYTEMGDAAVSVPGGGHDWASLRKLLSNAKRAGILKGISEQVINDFAVVFSLTQKQMLVLKDIILQAKEE